MTAVLDASALLAWLQEEPGAEVVRDLLTDGLVTAANWSEVLQKTDQHGRDMNEVAILLQALGLEVIEVTQEDGEEAAQLWSRALHFSLADRLCLAAAKRLGLPAATAEVEWEIFQDDIDITVIR